MQKSRKIGIFCFILLTLYPVMAFQQKVNVYVTQEEGVFYFKFEKEMNITKIDVYTYQEPKETLWSVWAAEGKTSLKLKNIIYGNPPINMYESQPALKFQEGIEYFVYIEMGGRVFAGCGFIIINDMIYMRS